MVNRNSEKGTIIVFALFVVMLLAGMSSAFLMLTTSQSQATQSQADDIQTLFIAKAGIGLAMNELNGGGDGVVSGTFAGGTYQTTVTPIGSDFMVTANSYCGYNKRGIEVVLSKVPTVPLPSINAEASVGIFGDPSKMKLSIPGNRQGGEDESLDRYVKIDGHDTSGNDEDILGFGIQGADAYKQLMDKIAQQIADGKLPASVFDGDPLVEYIIGDKKKKTTTITTSVGMVPTPSLDADWWQSKAESIADGVAALAPTLTINTDDAKITGTVYWGSSSSDVTVVNAQRLEVIGGGAIHGTGTLIINGDISIKQNGVFDWDGPVIVTGGTTGTPKGNDAILNNQRGSVDINGMLLILGTGKSKAEVKINDPLNNEDASTKFNGAVMILSGQEDKPDKATFKVNHGGVEMDGILMLIGDKVKLEIHKQNNMKQFDMDGSVILAVPPDAKKTQASLKIGGYTTITYNSQKTSDAIDSLMSFLENLGTIVPTTLSITSWREVTPP